MILQNPTLLDQPPSYHQQNPSDKPSKIKNLIKPKTAAPVYQTKKPFIVEMVNNRTFGLRKGSLPVGFKHRKASFNNHDAQIKAVNNFILKKEKLDFSTDFAQVSVYKKNNVYQPTKDSIGMNSFFDQSLLE